jgi:hypothetical protein
MPKPLCIALAAAFFLCMSPSASYAYVGPGAGITMLGALWAVLVAVFMVCAGILVFPVRVLIRKLRRKSRREAGDEDTRT